MHRFLSLVLVLQLLLTIAQAFELFEFEKKQLQVSNILARSEEASLVSFPRSDTPARTNTACKVFPTDASWPSDAQWALLNKTVNGALIKTVPLASPCYISPFSDFNTNECTYITAQWTNSSLQ
jgi:hypothetical protein